MSNIVYFPLLVLFYVRHGHVQIVCSVSCCKFVLELDIRAAPYVSS